MDRLFSQTLRNMQATLDLLASRVPAPQKVPYKDGFVYRYVERTIGQAIVQKLARIVSGLHAAWLLLERGLVQEQGAIQRMLDEFQEDVTFLAYALISGEVTTLHNEYLAAFYEEEFDKETPLESTQKRQMTSRRKIRAYIARIEDAGDPSTGVELYRTISKAYSGFVHGASPHIMDMYGGEPPRFHASGMLGTPRIADHRNDLWNYFYRGIIAFGISAKAFRDNELFLKIRGFSVEFERQAGRNYGS